MKKKQQQYGQYFTENTLVKYTLDVVKDYSYLNGDCLEPSFGDGDFIEELKNYDLNIDAYEIDTEIFKDKFDLSNVKLFNNDFIYNNITKK